MKQTDTIVAPVTPFGRGGVGILRISGPSVARIAHELLGKLPRPRQAEHLCFLDNDRTTLDQGIALFFPKPRSFTGEDVLELQGHGSPVVLDILLQRIISMPDTRIARPGEFSERAFLNNKIDLTQAEAIADLINASSTQATRLAINSLQGFFSKRINEFVEAITNLRTHIEVAIDFPDEGIDFLSDNKIEASLNNIIVNLNQICIEARQSNLLREGMKVVITGEPNTGKSSLLNALSGRETAIVTPIAGTTRDILHEDIYLDGMPVHIIDTAGLHKTSNEIERIGIERAWYEIKQADHVLLVVDSTSTRLSTSDVLWPEFITTFLPKETPITVVRNKSDLTGEKAGKFEVNGYCFLTLSAHSREGLDLLCTHLKRSMSLSDGTEGRFLARRRHLTALDTAANHLAKGKERLMIDRCSSELLAEELRLAQQALHEITGECSSEDLLRQIFSKFCIGK